MEPIAKPLIQRDPLGQAFDFLLAHPLRVEFDAEVPGKRDQCAEIERLAAPGRVCGAGTDMRAHQFGRHELEKAPLDCHPAGRIDVVAGPEAMRPRGESGVDAASASRARFDFDVWKRHTNSVPQGPCTKHLRMAAAVPLRSHRRCQRAVVIPFEISHGQIAQKVAKRRKQVLAHFGTGQVEDQLMPRFGQSCPGRRA